MIEDIIREYAKNACDKPEIDSNWDSLIEPARKLAEKKYLIVKESLKD